MKKIAVLFPGIGYTCDKPLLYYSSRLARAEGYEIKRAEYGGFPSGVKGDRAKMEESFSLALAGTEKSLSGTDWKDYDDILFIGKSIGSIVCGAYANAHMLKVRSILYTPLTDTYRFASPDSVAFHGTADPWADTEEITILSRQMAIPLFLTEDANHSLETGDAIKDLRNLQHVMEISLGFIKKLSD